MAAATGRVFFLLVVFVFTAAVNAESNHIHFHFKDFNGTYQSRFENHDLDLILASRRLVHNYVACLMDFKPCTAEGDELKRVLPDALHTKCAKCSVKQKEAAKKAIWTLQTRYPEQWQILKMKWDLESLKSWL